MNLPELGALKNLIVVGDRLLLRPDPAEERTRGGLYLPASVKAKEEIRSGRVLKVGPGYPIPTGSDPEEYLAERAQAVQYVPLQAHEGDLAVYLPKHAHEIEYNGEKFVIVPQAAVLLLIRDELAELDIH